jgi:PEP-CTERM motif
VVIPEPATGSLLVSGLLALAVRRRHSIAGA